ncbi:MAG: diguanylate cyclase [Gammaproteobacteria bacterium]|nr:diguanylate cyclase [Gammaproteobacteria bacterium]
MTDDAATTALVTPAAATYVAWLRQRGRAEMLAGALAALAFAALLWGTLAPVMLSSWLALLLLLSAGRLVGDRLFPEPGRALASIYLNLALAGLAWGGAGLAVAGHLPALNAAVALLTIGMLAAAVAASYAAALQPTLLFVLPALLPGGLRTLAAAEPASRAAGLLLLMLAGLLALSAWMGRRFVPGALRCADDYARSREEVDNFRAQFERLAVTAKAHAEKRAEAERDLRRASADLGLLKGKTFALSQTLERVSPLCPVTGLPNRRSFDKALAREWDRALRDGKSLSLALCDLDAFTQYKSTFDQQSVDALLQRVARVLGETGNRSCDLGARFGESQIALLWPGADTRNALRMAQEAVAKVEAEQIQLDLPDCPPHATIHAGVATVVPTRELLATELIERADSALQQAALAGVNTVVQHRALYAYRLERWQPQQDGEYSEKVLIQKILHWGFEGRRISYEPGRNIPDRALDYEQLKAVTGGELLIVLDGQQLVLRAGDCVFIPAGTTVSLAAVGGKPVSAIDGRRRGSAPRSNPNAA